MVLEEPAAELVMVKTMVATMTMVVEVMMTTMAVMMEEGIASDWRYGRRWMR